MPRLLRTVARTAVDRGHRERRQRPRLSAARQNKWSQQEAAQAPPPEAAPAAAARAGAASMIDQLKELGELKSQGILTEDEFAAQKAKLLAS